MSGRGADILQQLAQELEHHIRSNVFDVDKDSGSTTFPIESMKCSSRASLSVVEYCKTQTALDDINCCRCRSIIRSKNVCMWINMGDWLSVCCIPGSFSAFEIAVTRFIFQDSGKYPVRSTPLNSLVIATKALLATS
ncbi:hypothetical protein EVAR_84576_1 [Eumeta japonica]|uniref:Uncharacterized protein n=1 Tax=Eumeta variegata TaxID=151549 RepID=A0A4C1ZMH1_EUMVA|nr:hypothetical protein EVAR_84576_1 [Eumeta japonica]